MNIPEDLKYTKEHEWVRVEEGAITVGITEFAQAELGELVFVEPPTIGKSFKKGSTLCIVESTKAASDVYAPVGGTVTAVNDRLANEPNLVNSKPYADGWLVKLEDPDAADLESLLDAAEYRAHLGDKI